MTLLKKKYLKTERKIIKGKFNELNKLKMAKKKKYCEEIPKKISEKLIKTMIIVMVGKWLVKK